MYKKKLAGILLGFNKNKINFHSHAVGMDCFVQLAVKTILCRTLLPDHLDDFFYHPEILTSSF